MKFLISLSLLFSTAVFAKHLQHEITFKNISIENIDGYQRIIVDNLNQSIKPFTPTLPFAITQITLPDNFKKIIEIKVVREQLEEIEGVDNLEMSQPLDGRATPLLSYSDFNSQEDYPAELSYHSVQIDNGQKLLIAKINPIFITTDKRVFFARKMTVELTYQEDLNTGNKSFNKIVANTLDYLIVSSASLIAYTGENSLHTFKKFLEENKNLKVEIVDIKDAIKIDPGVDDAQSLRNYLRQKHYQRGFKYLLLAGDSDQNNPTIPIRMLFSSIKGFDGRWRTINGQIPSDFYYSCLDGTFNNDNDAFWGESNDGPNGLDVDFMCELTVGRWSVDNSNQLTKIVAKTLMAYQMNSRTKKTLMLGEELFSQLNLWGGDYMNHLIGGSNDHNITTRGYDSSWQIDKLYDKDEKWSGSSAQKMINKNDYLIVNHLGHSNTTYNMRLYNRSIKQYNNTNPFFLYTQGCYPGHFIENDSFIENLIYNQYGIFAAVANSHYGLGPEDPEPNTTVAPGTSQILHRFFTDRILNENYLHFGEAHRKSKEDILIYIDHPEARWVSWAATFFGDPAL